jgi:hypothetical protein
MRDEGNARYERMAEETFQRIAGDLAMITDRAIEVQSVSVQRLRERAVGRGGVHISFKLGFQYAGEILHGCILVPLPDAVTLACYLMMVPDDAVKAKRSLQTLDASLKDALLEVGNFVGGATDAALRGLGIAGIQVRSESCQGVRAGVRPAFAYRDGDELVVGRAQVRVHDWPAFEAVLLLPAFTDPVAASAAPA